MRILILNWRCPLNPKAGGAEIVTHRVAQWLVANGHSVEWFSASYPGAKLSEVVDGVQIVRRGRQWTVHWLAFRRYHRKLRRRFDVVVDQVNTMPFFTPLWADIPTVMFIHQLAREVWWYESPFPLSAAGYIAEPIYLRVYKQTPVLTVSQSTKDDLRQLGLKGSITILPEGIEVDPALPVAKVETPTILFVGRLAPSKRVDHIVRAFAMLRQKGQPAQLWIVGDGLPDYLAALRRLVSKLGIDADVTFLGKVSPEEKQRRMSGAHLLVMASVREGWGLVVTEAAACGTPAIVYDVGGLRDAVRDGQTGLVVGTSPDKLAQGMSTLLSDAKLYRRMSIAAAEWGRTFSFEASGRVFAERLGEVA